MAQVILRRQECKISLTQFNDGGIVVAGNLCRADGGPVILPANTAHEAIKAMYDISQLQNIYTGIKMFGTDSNDVLWFVSDDIDLIIGATKSRGIKSFGGVRYKQQNVAFGLLTFTTNSLMQFIQDIQNLKEE